MVPEKTGCVRLGVAVRKVFARQQAQPSHGNLQLPDVALDDQNPSRQPPDSSLLINRIAGAPGKESTGQCKGVL